MWDLIEKGLEHNGLVTAFAFVGVIMWVSVVLSKRLTFGRIYGSAIAIVIGLVLAWVGGTMTGGQKGLADLDAVFRHRSDGRRHAAGLCDRRHGVRSASHRSEKGWF